MDSHYAVGPVPTVDARAALLQFRMTADADPGMLPRLMQVFAKRSLVPEAVRAERRESGDSLSVELRIPAIEPARAMHVAACLRETVGVRTVLGPVALETG